MAKADREKTGQFKPGTSGNPSGRPKESAEALSLIKGATPDIVKIAIKKARAGNFRFIKLLLDKMLPDLKSIEKQPDDSMRFLEVTFKNE